MFKKPLVLFILLLIISGCGSNDVKKNVKNENQDVNNDKLVIKTNVTNKEEKGGYLIYFMHVGERNEVAGEANQ